MNIQRYCFSPRNLDGTIYIGQYCSILRSWEWRTIGSPPVPCVMCRCQFSDLNEAAGLVAAQADPKVTVCPSESAQAIVIPAATALVLINMGAPVTPAASAQVIDRIRSIRDAMVAAGNPWFDVSSAS